MKLRSDLAFADASIQASGGLVWTGAWAAGTAYRVNDLATSVGVIYRRIVAGTTATAPAADATNWQLMASTGSPTGAAGGDLSGTYPNPVVAKASGAFPVSGTGKTAVTIADSGAQSSGLTIGGDTNLYRSAAHTLKTDDSLTVAATLKVGDIWTGNISGGGLTYPGGPNLDRHKRFVRSPAPVAASRRLVIATLAFDPTNWTWGGMMEVICRNDYYTGGLSRVMVVAGAGLGNEATVELIDRSGPQVAVPRVSASTLVGAGPTRTVDVYVDVPSWGAVSVEVDTELIEVTSAPTALGTYRLVGTVSDTVDPGYEPAPAWRGAWALDSYYAAGDKVSYLGAVYERKYGGSDATNLVTNPSLETNVTGWGAASCTIARSTAQAKFGTASLAVTAPAANSYVEPDTLTCAASTTYAYGAWVYSAAGGTFFASLTDNIEQGLTGSAVTVPAGVWTLVSNVATTDAHTTRYLAISIGGSPTPTPYFVDGAIVVKGYALPPYFDGSIAGAAWTGAANASTSAMLPPDQNAAWKLSAPVRTGYDTAPIGAIISSTRSTWSDEYVLANGQSLSQALYPDAYAVAQAEVAASNPLWTVTGTNFTVPDLRDRFLYGRGADTAGTPTNRTLLGLKTDGEATHPLTIAEMPAHTHDADVRSYAMGGAFGLYAPALSADVANASGVFAKTKGGGGSHNNMPPYAVLVFLVKVRGVSATASVITGPAGAPGAAGGSSFSTPIGDGASVAFSVVHGFGTRNVSVSCYQSAAPYNEVTVDVERTDANTVTVRTEGPAIATSAYTVIVAAAGATTQLSSGLAITLDSWHVVNAPGEPAWGAGCSSTETVAFRKFPDGKVKLRGFITTPAGGGLAFTLPVGYRPPRNYYRWRVQVDVPTPGSGRCYITNLGAVVLDGFAGSTVWSLDGIEFDSETVLQTASVAAQPLDNVHYVDLPAGTTGEPKFIGANGWVNYDTPGLTARNAAFRKDPFGKVRLSGCIKSGTPTTSAFALPVGYRPRVNTTFFTVSGATGAGSVYVGSDGSVVPAGTGTATYTYLDGIEFDTESVSSYASGSLPGPALVGALPVSPVDGAECYFQDTSMAAAGVVWHLRWRLGAPHAWNGALTGAWELVGGNGLLSGPLGSLTTASLSPTWQTITGGPSLTVPLAGEYEVEHGAYVTHSAAQAWYASVAVAVNGANPAGAGAVHQSSGIYDAGLARGVERRTLAATNALTVLATLQAAYSTTINSVTLKLTPVRLG